MEHIHHAENSVVLLFLLQEENQLYTKKIAIRINMHKITFHQNVKFDVRVQLNSF